MRRFTCHEIQVHIVTCPRSTFENCGTSLHEEPRRYVEEEDLQALKRAYYMSLHGDQPTLIHEIQELSSHHYLENQFTFFHFACHGMRLALSCSNFIIPSILLV